jgi:hypothetical protein
LSARFFWGSARSLPAWRSPGTPLPNPPFTNGGFVAPDSITLKQEVAVGKLLTKYAASLAKSDQSALLALQLAYQPTNQQKVPAVQAKWTVCRDNAVTKYGLGRDKLLLKGTPACLDQAGIDAIKAQIDDQFPLLGPIVYCDDGAASPDPMTLLNIPDLLTVASSVN